MLEPKWTWYEKVLNFFYLLVLLIPVSAYILYEVARCRLTGKTYPTGYPK